jgi:hypothetical protein
MKSARFFRWLWRVNAIVIFLVAAAMLCGIGTYLINELLQNRRRAEEQPAPVVRQANVGPTLRLGQLTPVAGTDLFRADLVAVKEGSRGSLSSSYDPSETHNVLFMNPQTGASRWLLPSHRRVMDQTDAIYTGGELANDRIELATVALLKDSPSAETGDLILYDPAATTVVQVASDVRRVHTTAAIGTSELLLVFERGGKYFVARYAAPSLRKMSETELRVPQLP